MSLAESTLLAYGRRSIFDAVGDKADTELFTALNDAIDMLAEDHRWPWLLRKATVSLQTPYATGTIAVTNASTTVTLTTGTWPTWAASGNLVISNKIYGVATRSSGSVILLDSAFGGDTASGLSFTIFQDEYSLTTNLLQFKRVLPGQVWGYGGDPVPIERLWEAQNSTNYGQQYPNMFAVDNGNLVLFPYPSENQSLVYTYYARPTPITGDGTGTLDWPDAHRSLLNRAYDFHLALRFGKVVLGDWKACLDLYNIALTKAKNNDQSPRDLPGMQELHQASNMRVPDWKRRA